MLILGKGKPKLTPSVGPPPPAPAFSTSIVNGHLGCSLRSKPLGSLADFLTTILTAPVTNETGLSGNFDIRLEFMPDDRWRGFPYLPAAKNAADPAPDLFAAIQDQLGLKLEARKGPVSVLVVDRRRQDAG